MVNTKLDNPFEEVEFVASSPLFLVKRMFDCPLSKQRLVVNSVLVVLMENET